MKKKTYLIFLLIVWFGGWDLLPYGGLTDDVKLFITLLTICLGFILYFTPVKRHILKDSRLKPFWWIMAGILLSMISAYYNYGQSLVQSLITYRSQLLWLVIPLLLVVSPTEKDVIGASKWITIIMVGVYFLRLSMPLLFAIDINELDEKELEHMYVNGYTIATIPVFYYLMRLRNQFKWYYIVIILSCYAFIFIMQNRSTLFPLSLLIVFSIFAFRSRSRFISVSLLILVGIFFIHQTADSWMSLFDETELQLEDQDYNRNIAFRYYILEANNNWFTRILGNGFLSSNTTSLMQDLMEKGIYNSDMGFIGFWNQYGVIPIIVFVWSMLIPLLRREQYSWYLKLWAIQMLASSITISYFGSHVHMIYYALYYYLFMSYYKRYDHNRPHQLSQRSLNSPLC